MQLMTRSTFRRSSVVGRRVPEPRLAGVRPLFTGTSSGFTGGVHSDLGQSSVTERR